ncbi:MAG: CHASE2 domain-containing protein [Halothece sp.]
MNTSQIKQWWQRWKSQLLPTVKHSENSEETPETVSLIQTLFKPGNWGHWLMGILAVSGAIATGANPHWVELLERQTQTFFFQVRGSVEAPDNIVILAIDEYSLNQGQFYQTNPQEFAHFEPLATWPWKREAYAIVIKRLMEAGAKAVAVDLILDRPSSYGIADDQQLREVLQAYSGKVTLAALYENSPIRQGSTLRLIQPNEVLQVSSNSIGSINFPIDANGRIHRFASQYVSDVMNLYSTQEATLFNELVATVPSFEEATLEAAGISKPQPLGNSIFFYGPPNTFEHISFSDVLDPDNWKTYLQNGEYFQDKIVLIGATANSFQDIHPTVFSEQMAGVEIHANAIATLLENRTLTPAPPYPWQQGLFVLIITLGSGTIISQFERWPKRLGIALGSAIAWGSLSYLGFIYGQLVFPTAVPVSVLALIGASYATVGSVQDLRNKRNLRKTFKQYASSLLVQEIISQQDDLKDIIEEREQEILNKQLGNGGRYKIIKLLGYGGFGETYIASDTQRPGNPFCLVKQLRPVCSNPQGWKLAKRLFVKEAEILERLGKHDQIPQLLAYFEEDEEFYLVEEFIPGHSLSEELPKTIPMTEAEILYILQDILQILAFVHSQGVIHRDIKPDNIIRRESDGKFVLIDFGAVKEISTQLSDTDDPTHLTVGIGTKGYMPNEQAVGNPRFNSDIYALGMIAIRAVTTIHPSYLKTDVMTGEIIWEEQADISSELKTILTQMVCYNFRDRYQSANEVLDALNPLIENLPENSYRKHLILKNSSMEFSSSSSDSDAATETEAESPTLSWSPTGLSSNFNSLGEETETETEPPTLLWLPGEESTEGLEENSVLNDLPEVSSDNSK